MDPLQTERQCELRFLSHGPFFHLHTNPLASDVFYHDDQDKILAMNRIALDSARYPIQILAFTLMSNHFHFIVEGNSDECLAFFNDLKESLRRSLSRKGRLGLFKSIQASATPITSLKQLRDEIAYVLRNPYVVRSDVNPLAYKWSSGYLYYNDLLPFLAQVPINKLNAGQKRQLSGSRNYALPEHLFLTGDYISPASYINPTDVEQYFSGARQFTLWVYKNIEAQVEVSARYNEVPNLNDDEVLRVTLQLCQHQFGAKRPSTLSESDKKQLAILLKNDYHVSNGQLARFTSLDRATISSLFPLAERPC